MGDHGSSLNNMMKRRLAFSRQYQTALQKHLQQRPGASVQPAHRLGQQAVTLGLETLDMASIHKTALTPLVLPGDSSATRNRMIKRAEIFFTEAILPIEKTHRAGVEAVAHLKRRNQALNQRTAQLASANHHLRHGIVRRKVAEDALKTSEQHYTKLLGESHHLQKHLQHLTHQILSAQEEERNKLSHELHDEIAQTLLGINVRLLTLKKAASARSEGLAKEIASTQRLVEKSVRSIDRFARKFGANET